MVAAIAVVTVVASYAWSKVTVPPSVETSIEPTYEFPSASVEGRSKKLLAPSSCTFIVKSVPLTDTEAVGDLIFTFSLEFFAILPEEYLIVPRAALRESLPVFLFRIINKLIY